MREGSSEQVLHLLPDRPKADPRGTQGLSDMGFQVVSTGGSAFTIEQSGVPVTRVDEITGYPEMLDGRVKTLHPAVHAGILAMRDNASHQQALEKHSIGEINVVVVNLYPFRETVTSDPPPAFAEGVEKIDIGGPTMIRAAAKNHKHVMVVVDPADYPKVPCRVSRVPTEGEDLLVSLAVSFSPPSIISPLAPHLPTAQPPPF